VVSLSIFWKEVLQNSLSSDVQQGIDCAIGTEEQVYDYIIMDGSAMFVGTGDLHEREYDGYRRSISQTPDEYFSNLSVNYTLSLSVPFGHVLQGLQYQQCNACRCRGSRYYPCCFRTILSVRQLCSPRHHRKG
jgi:hypothetical protein